VKQQQGQCLCVPNGKCLAPTPGPIQPPIPPPTPNNIPPVNTDGAGLIDVRIVNRVRTISIIDYIIGIYFNCATIISQHFCLIICVACRCSLSRQFPILLHTEQSFSEATTSNSHSVDLRSLQHHPDARLQSRPYSGNCESKGRTFNPLRYENCYEPKRRHSYSVREDYFS